MRGKLRSLETALKRCMSLVSANFLPLKRYDVMIYRELIVSYLVSFVVISLIVWLKEIYLIYVQYIQKGAQFLTTLKIFLFSLPFTMAITLPASMVMATLFTFNKLSINLEVLVLRSSGVRKVRLFLPVLVFSLFIAAVTYIFFDTVLIKGNEMYIRSMIQMRVEKPFIDIAPGEFPKIGEFNIGFEEIYGDEMKGVEIYQKLLSGERIIKASRGKIISTGDLPYYEVLLFDGTFVEKTRGGEIFSSQFKEAELRIDYEVSYIPTFNTETQPRLMSRYKTARKLEGMERSDGVRRGLEEIKTLTSSLVSTYLRFLAVLPSHVVGLIFGGEIGGEFNEVRKLVARIHDEMKRVNTRHEMVTYNFFLFEQHKKTSIPVSAVVYGLIGFTFGIMIRLRTGRGGSLIIGIVVILVQTYLTYVAEIPVRHGDLNPIVAAWYSNVLLSIPAIYMLLREKV